MTEFLALVLEDPTRAPRAFWQALVIPVCVLILVWLGMKFFRKGKGKGPADSGNEDEGRDGSHPAGQTSGDEPLDNEKREEAAP